MSEMNEEERNEVIEGFKKYNRAVNNAKHKKWRDANKEHLRAYWAAYYAVNGEKINEQRRVREQKRKENGDATRK